MGNENQLITADKALMGGEKRTITTLEIAEMMNIGHWQVLRKLDGREENGKHIKGYVEVLTDNQMVVSDYFSESVYKDASGKENRCYDVTRLGCDFLANKFTGEKGILFTALYVKRFNEMEQDLAPKVPKTYKEALLETVRLLEENEALEKENEEMRPKAEFFDAVVGSKDAIEIGKVAKVLNFPGIGRNKLFEILRDKGILMKNNIPYQKYIDNGCFRTIEQKYSTPDGEIRISIKTLVYQKGVDFIRKTLEAA